MSAMRRRGERGVTTVEYGLLLAALIPGFMLLHISKEIGHEMFMQKCEQQTDPNHEFGGDCIRD